MTYCAQMATVCVSQPSTIALFPGFGVKKVALAPSVVYISELQQLIVPQW